MVIHENPFARKALPRDVFCGPWDVRWAMESNVPIIIFRREKVCDDDGALKFPGR